MRSFTDNRNSDTVDELWVVEHNSVYTQGQAGKGQHLLNPGNIPVVQTDRGGQVTWHGPGQVVVYTLVDLRRRSYGIRGMVERLEQAVIDTLEPLGISALSRRDAPGVYVGDEKIAALGLRVRRSCTYHGLSLNVTSAADPWLGINPCGFAGLGVTSVAAQGVVTNVAGITQTLLPALQARLSSNLVK